MPVLNKPRMSVAAIDRNLFKPFKFITTVVFGYKAERTRLCEGLGFYLLGAHFVILDEKKSWPFVFASISCLRLICGFLEITIIHRILSSVM